jgi:hypothetical protein
LALLLRLQADTDNPIYRDTKGTRDGDGTYKRRACSTALNIGNRLLRYASVNQDICLTNALLLADNSDTASERSGQRIRIKFGRMHSPAHFINTPKIAPNSIARQMPTDAMFNQSNNCVLREISSRLSGSF